MRLVKVSAPQGMGARVAEVAFSVGINEVSVRQEINYSADGRQPETKDAVDLATSTPKSKYFIDALLKTDFYDRDKISIAIRQPRSIISGEHLNELTRPLVDPATDIFEELWQFSHITVGFVGRIFIAACLLAYGLIHQKTLIIIAGLLFLPLLPTLLAIGFGSWTGRWKLAGKGALAFLVATILLVLGGLAVAAISSPPVQYEDFTSLPVTILITAGVGVAAGLANIDDVGNRAMIGLAATSQIAIIPVWLAVCFVMGFPTLTDESKIGERALSFLAAVVTIIVTSLATYVLTGAASRSISNLRSAKK